MLFARAARESPLVLLFGHATRAARESLLVLLFGYVIRNARESLLGHDVLIARENVPVHFLIIFCRLL